MTTTISTTETNIEKEYGDFIYGVKRREFWEPDKWGQFPTKHWRRINNYIMGGGGSHWWEYEVEFDIGGTQDLWQDVMIHNKDGLKALKYNGPQSVYPNASPTPPVMLYINDDGDRLMQNGDYIRLPKEEKLKWKELKIEDLRDTHMSRLPARAKHALIDQYDSEDDKDVAVDDAF